MSMRGTKRATVVRDGEQPSTSTAGLSTSGTSSSKRRRTDPEDPLWQLRPVSDLKMSSIYNSRAPEAPAELFRKDLISAMKLPDNEPLTSSEYWVITDPWKQDWERGVQVPVNPDSLPAPKVKIIDNPMPPGQAEFKLPKDKYIHLSRDAHYTPDKHLLSSTPASAEAACSYDLDANDTSWLRLLNAERARAGAAPITEDQFERVIEELELRTWDKIQAIMKSEEGLGIEYDENVICDVCRSPDSEDGNEMVFCDSCNICVHQACYGITVIPDGQWLCRPCGDGAKPTCVLCPNQGGAMKCTPSGHKWAHVSCVLWIPEVSIGCAEKMEPITKISSIPASRWSLMCVLCRERKGACIQCSVKSCKTAYHVTCAFRHGLEMRAIIEDENADDGVKLRSYCQKHSVNSKKEKAGSGSEEEEVKRKRRKDMTSEEKTQARAARLYEIEKEFDKHVSVKDISSHLLEVDQDAINYIYNYWKLKRRSGHNRPLLTPKSDDTELLSHKQEQADLDKMKMFVQLRQDLERVRNLCYMVSRREKLSRSFFRLREQTFHKQIAVLSGGADIPEAELSAIYEANHGPSIYDKLYSNPDSSDTKKDFNDILAKIAPDSSDEKKKDRNGMRRSKSSNPYKKQYVNGARRSGSLYSGLSSEESEPEVVRAGKLRARALVGSSTDDDVNRPSTSTAEPKKKVSPKAKPKRSPKKSDKKKKTPKSKAVVESSSEDETAITLARAKKDKAASKTLRQMEKEMAAGKVDQSGTDSDDLMPIRTTRSSKFPVDIYSDSSEASTQEKPEVKKETDKIKHEKHDKLKSEKSPSTSDPQQSLPRTKAAMKEFVPSHAEKKESQVTEEKPAPKKRGRKPSNKEKKPPVKIRESDDEAKNKENKFSKPKDNPTDLIVPQRQAAKKASENMRSTSTGKKEDNAVEKSPEEIKVKSKGKGKGKEIKSPPAKLSRQTSKEAEKETIAYVPQRQAAKKAAAHIKNIGSKVPVPETDTAKKKEEKSESSKSSDESPTKKKVVDSKESSSSSSNSSSSSYSSSSSSDEEPEPVPEPEKAGLKPTAKAREIKPASAAKPPSVFSPPSTRPTVDLPFLDKVSRPLSSTSASSDSESSQSDATGSSSPTIKRPRRRRKHKSEASNDASPRKAPDKKLKTSERESECRVPSPAAEREEPARAPARAATRARTRSTTAGGGLPNKSDAGSRKPSKDDSGYAADPNTTPKESRQSGKLSSPERKAHEEIKQVEKKQSPAKGRRKSVSAQNAISKVEPPKNDIKAKTSKSKRLSIFDDKEHRKATEESRKAPQEHRKAPEEHRKAPEEHRKVHEDHRKATEEHRKAPEEHRKVPEEYRKAPEEYRKAPEEHRKAPEELRKVHEEHRKTNEEHRKAPEEHRKAPEEHRKAHEEHRKASVEHRKAPEVNRKPHDEHRKQHDEHRKAPEEHRKAPQLEPSPTRDRPCPKKSSEHRRKSISSRRMSVKEPSQKDAKDQVVPIAEEVIKPIKQRRQSRYDTRDTNSTRTSDSPCRKSVASEIPQAEVPDKKTPIRMNDDYNDSEKWLPKAPSPTHVLTPIERPGGNEKYMTDDKSFDSADVCAEKSSVKMIAKIQANLNENTMIKSPRTPMDARSLAMEDENLLKNIRKRSTLETMAQQDVQAVEISKSAKIPSNVYHDRPPTSPQQKDNELFAFDMLAVDDPFNHEEIMKPFSSYPEFFFKDDSKEQGAQESLNLVDRLRMQLSTKKVSDNGSQESSEEKDNREVEDSILACERDKEGGEQDGHGMSPEREIISEMDPHPMASPKQMHNSMNHIQHSIAPAEMPRRMSMLDEGKEYHLQMPMTSNDKWGTIPAHADCQMEHETKKYEHSVYNDEMKEPSTVSDAQSASEVGDTTSLSKQSDDSQPSAVDNSNSVIDVELIQDAQNYDNNNSVIHSECVNITSSPYIGHECKWRESKIATRRSSASSTNSEGSMVQEHAMKAHMNSREGHAAAMPEIDSYPPIPAYSCPVEPSMPLNQYATYPPDASPFLTTMSSLFGSGACSQLPLPSPGPLYAPGLPYSSGALLPPKQGFQLCAAFTSSSQNIALTTAMIAPPTPKPVDSPTRDDTLDATIDVTGSDKFSMQASSPSICVDDSTYETSQSRITKMSNDSNETVTSVSQQESKSPPKSVGSLKSHLKFPGKSPGKSPGISPKQSEAPKGSKRSNNKGNRGHRGRGRSKSRGLGAHAFPPAEYMGNSIQNKLVGTVYDFEEEMANDGVDLKALRERRKSVDVRDERRSEHSLKEASQSPRTRSPRAASPPSGPVVPAAAGMAPLLPGPVDMRTYQVLEPPSAAYQQLAAYPPPSEAPAPAPPAPAPAPADPYPPLLPKVSLADSRNQLKVKIKGPFLDANYSAHSVTPVVVPPPAPPLEQPAAAALLNAAGMTAAMMSGSTNLRRMRKKELLRQYWTQDMNMDEATSGAMMGAVPPPAVPSPLTRAVITIPKAVASMTSIPTREDYKIADPPTVEKKKRKVSCGLSRELRHLKVTMNDDVDLTDDVKLSNIAGVGALAAHKRRPRLSKPAKHAATAAVPASGPHAPKLKIKIGANTVAQVSEEPSDFRPPKKRLVHKPSLEDLRRESMKYRKMVMADFEENEKTTKHKLSKSEKRKKKKDKKAEKLKKVLNSESETAPKLIIKIKRPAAVSGAEGAAAAAPEPPVAVPLEYDPTLRDPLAIDEPAAATAAAAVRKVRTAKVTPIRLKLARTQGSSYVMKDESPASAPAPATAPAPAPAPAPASAPDEHSDVR